MEAHAEDMLEKRAAPRPGLSGELIAILAVGVMLAGLVFTTTTWSRDDLRFLRGDMLVLRDDMQTLHQDVRTLHQDVQILRQDVQNLRDDVRSVQSGLSELRERVVRVETLLEERSAGPREE